jgi:hypothetical protein
VRRREAQLDELCVAVGADQTLIERWITVGRQRAATVRAMRHAGHRVGEQPTPFLSQMASVQRNAGVRVLGPVVGSLRW